VSALWMSCACSCWSRQCVLAANWWCLGTLASGILVSLLPLGSIGLLIITLLKSLFRSFSTLGSIAYVCGDWRTVLFGSFVPVSKDTIGVCSTLGALASGVVSLGYSILGSTAFIGIGIVSTCVGGGVLVRSSSRHFIDSIWSSPSKFVFPLSACVRSGSALMIMSAKVTVVCVIYLCLNHIVYDILMLLIFFIYFVASVMFWGCLDVPFICGVFCPCSAFGWWFIYLEGLS
jgi:hypothetical protein